MASFADRSQLIADNNDAAAENSGTQPTLSEDKNQTSDSTEKLPLAPIKNESPTLRRLPVFSIGAGVRSFSQDTTQAAIQGSARLFQTGNKFLSSGSIRPAIIIPANCEGCKTEYRVAATFDFFQHDVFSFYAGGGAAFNKDGGDGKTYGMFTGGVEFKVSRNFALTGNLNLIGQSSPPEFGGLTWADAETSFFLTFRF